MSERQVHGVVAGRYKFTGFISSGTYGRVYRAKGINGVIGDFAIKKSRLPCFRPQWNDKINDYDRFKPDKEGETAYTGISQSAIREMAICAELNHPNIIRHIETVLDNKAIYMVFQYCEHDLLQMVHRHSQTIQRNMPASTVKSILYQLLRGCHYLHENWIMHRDLKPANIMVTSEGQVMIGDLGLARIFREPLVPLWNGDKVVVTIWYRAPELLMGAKHYTPAVDLWAIGCIFGELLALKPIFKGEEAKMENKNKVPFQKNQMQKIVEVMGAPTLQIWPSLAQYPESERNDLRALLAANPKLQRPQGLENWYHETLRAQKFPAGDSPGKEGLSLMSGLLQYDPEKRLTAAQALEHPYFADQPSENCFEGSDVQYPLRKITQDDATTNTTASKRAGAVDEPQTGRPAKKMKDG